MRAVLGPLCQRGERGSLISGRQCSADRRRYLGVPTSDVAGQLGDPRPVRLGGRCDQFGRGCDQTQPIRADALDTGGWCDTESATAVRTASPSGTESGTADSDSRNRWVADATPTQAIADLVEKCRMRSGY